MAKVLVLHGPNLNLLGTREPEIYGSATLADINDMLKKRAEEAGVGIDFLQSNHEGVLVDAVQASRGKYDYIIFNLIHNTILLINMSTPVQKIIPCIIGP